jgi:hypothetical protein
MEDTMQTLTSSKNVSKEINKLVSFLADDIAGLNTMGDKASKLAANDKAKLIKVLEGARGALGDLDRSQTAWRNALIKEL